MWIDLREHYTYDLDKGIYLNIRRDDGRLAYNLSIFHIENQIGSWFKDHLERLSTPLGALTSILERLNVD